MADYPPTPPFGMAPTRAVPPYREASHQDMYDYGDAVQPERRPTLEYHKAQTRAAFEQNAKIPGFSAASVASGIPPLPIYQDQESLPYGYPAASYGRDGALEPPRNRNMYTKPSNISPLELSQTVPHERNHKRPPSYTPAAPNAEEGELSEGEFEEVRPNSNRIAAGMTRRDDYYEHQREDPHRHSYRGANKMISHAPLTDMYGRSLDLNQHRSESYSPYDPPNEIEYEPHPAQEVFAPGRQLSYHEEYEPPEEFPHLQRVRQNEYRSESSRVESFDSPGHNYREPKIPMANMDMQSIADAPGLIAAVKSLHNARKEAQNAILNLLPLKVRYNDYLEEGIDEEVVRRQFESLGVPLAPAEIPPIKHYGERMIESPSSQSYSALARNIQHGGSFLPSSPQASQANPGHVYDNASLYGNFTLPENASSYVAKDSDRTPDNQNSIESRKDRIARLLAEKKKKQPSPLVQSESPLHSASPEASTVNKASNTSQSAAKADKERLLRQKMEALQKSREQRAQKAAAKTATIAPAIAAATAEDNAQKSTNKSILENQHSSEHPLPRPTSPVPIVNKQAMPSIPGLFLASGPSAPQSPARHIIASNTVQNGTQRKRPVASDFDRPSSTASSHKRPFGQNRNDQPLVIDVSDDDSDEGNYSDMDIDPPQTISSGIHSQSGASTAKSKAIRDLPPLSDFPPRKPFLTPSSTMSTPSATQPSKAPVNKPEDLHRKELEIQEMKRKIAEAERRKRAKQNSSGSQTPRPNDATSSPAKNNGISLADKIEASVQIEHLIDDASRQVDQDQQKLAEAQAEERAKADDLKRSEAERRRLRRAEIASNLPVVDAEVEKAQKQLADLRAEMARIEAAVQKGLDDKRRLAEEMEKLGQEADEQLQAQKEKLNELKLEEAGETRAAEQAGHGNPISIANTTPLAEEGVDATISELQPAPNPELHHEVQPNLGKEVLDARASMSRPQSAEIPIGSTEQEHEPPGQPSPEQRLDDQDGSSADMTPDQALEAALQEATAQANIQSYTGSASDVEMADSFAPDPDALAPASTESCTGSSQHDNGLIESSEEPMDVGDGESDPYEPPEATPPPEDALSSPDSPPFSPAPPEAISGSSHVDKQHDDVSTGPDEVTASKALINADDLALPPAQANQDSSTLASRKTFYTPYESPLKNFRAFRFHPTFEQEVQGGFKSITYSNNIKDEKELCRYELAGGVCNDSSCEFQHFRDMGLADDAILVELGNSAGYSEEDKPRFVAGLRTVLQGLRANKTKDFHVIASEIAAYRARFLGDKSKILLLEEPST